MEEISNGVIIWWFSLSTISILNIIIWIFALKKKLPFPKNYDFRIWQLIFSSGFVFGCASRSFILRADVQRFCMIDSWVASVFVGRTIATVAELCFMAQASLYLYEFAKESNSSFAMKLSKIIVPIIAIAETFSWYAVLTTNYIGNVFEESLWGISGAILLIGFITLWPAANSKMHRFLLFIYFFIGSFITFMSTVDVPMYIFRWTSDQLNQQKYLTLSEGLWDASHRWVVTYKWEDWNTEIPWMSLYFSVIVWLSIYLIFAPKFKNKNT
ncbi:MAG: hypothetical protein AABZ74_03290 [Cyanobacteriota bacterium]